MRKNIARAVALAAVLAAAFATPALADGGTTGHHDNGRHCGTVRGKHKGWIHHAKTHKTGRGCPAHPSSTTTKSDDETSTTPPSHKDDNGQGDDDHGQSGDDNDRDEQGDDAKGNDDAQGDEQDD